MKRIRVFACSTLLTLPLMAAPAAPLSTSASSAAMSAPAPTSAPAVSPTLGSALSHSLSQIRGMNRRATYLRAVHLTYVRAKAKASGAASTPAAPVGSVRSMIIQVFGPYAAKAIRVATCESGLNPNARNPSGASGVFQILPSTWAMTPYHAASLFNAWANINAAHWLFVRDGDSWREWQCGAA